MNGIKQRITVVSLIVFAVVFFWFCIDWLGDIGVTASEISGAEDTWGFVWTSENLGWLIFFVVIAFGVGYMVLASKFHKHF